MIKPVIQRLFLAAPLIYLREASGPAWEKDFALPFTGERLYCFELNPLQALEFEPDMDSFIKALVYKGRAMSGNNDESCAEAPLRAEALLRTEALLPAGNYLFAQEEGLLDKGIIMEIAVELQQEGLWQRLKPETCFYVRHLAEDGRNVTQLFRPYSLNASTM